MDHLLYKEVTQSIKAIFDLTARIDERVKMLLEKDSQKDSRIDNVIRSINELNTKVSILENKDSGDILEDMSEFHQGVKDLNLKLHNFDIRLSSIEKSSSHTEQRWQVAISFVRDTIWVIVVSYLLYKMNLQSDILP